MHQGDDHSHPKVFIIIHLAYVLWTGLPYHYLRFRSLSKSLRPLDHFLNVPISHYHSSRMNRLQKTDFVIFL